MGEPSDSGTILCVCPPTADRETVTTKLEAASTYTIVTADTAEDGRNILAQDAIDCVVCEQPLAESDALAFLESVRRNSAVPFVLYSRDGSERLATRAFRLGVTDYVPATDSDSDELLRRIRTAITQSEQSEQKVHTEQPEQTALPEQSEQKVHTEQHSESLAELFEILSEELPGSIYIVTEGGTCLEAIPGRDLGVPTVSERFRGQTIDDIFPADVADTFNTAIESAAQTGQKETVTVSLDSARDSILLEGEIVPLRESYRTENALLVFTKDLSTRRDHERKLKQYTELVDAVGDPMFVLDAEGYIEQVNEALLAYTEYQRSELLGRAIGEIVPAKGFNRATQELTALQSANEGEKTFETKLVTRDGELIHTEANVSVLTDDQGEYDGAVGVLRDIRTRKRRERDLDLLKQVLARVFRHNVRNELTTVRIYAELINDRVSADLQEYTQTILNRAQQLREHSEKATLIEQVTETETLSETNLQTTVETLAEPFRESSPNATIDIDIPSGTTVEAHSMIGEAIEELIDNAIQHAPADADPTIRIWTEEDEGFLTLYVEDESGGLAEHEIDVLRQGVESDLEHSSGVGLWLVRWLVEYSDADMIAHQTTDGSLMGIRFSRPDTQPTAAIEESSFARVPAHVRENDPQKFRGDLVIGRMEELHELEDIYDAVQRTGGHVALITGETGIGKSTLVEQFLTRVREYTNPPLIGTGQCTVGVTVSYTVFRQAIDDLPVDTPLQTLGLDPEPLDDATVEDSPADPAENLDDPETTQHRKQTLFAGIADELRSLAIDHPLVLVLEDLQWADQGTIDLFEFLIDEVGRWAPPILFIGTYQTDEVDETHPVWDITDQTTTTGRGTVLELEPFDRREVTNLLASELSVESIPDDIVDTVSEHTGAKPLFVTEIARHLSETIGPDPTPEELSNAIESVAVPDSVESAIVDRLERLADTVTETLQVGAVIGQQIPRELLIESCDMSESQLTASLDKLVERNIWQQSDGGYQFVHGIMREVALDRIPTPKRERLHRQVARAIQTVLTDTIENQYGRLATHYHEAGHFEEAFDYYCRAGEQATETYAHDDAIAHYERAISLGRSNDFASDADLATLFGDVADIYRSIGEFDNARDTTSEGLAVAPDSSREHCRLLGIEASVLYHQSSYKTAREKTLHQQELADELDELDLEARAIRRLGLIARDQGNYHEARESLQESLTLTEEIGGQQVRARGLKELGTTMYYMGEYNSAHEYWRRSLDIYRDTENRRGEGRCLNNLGLVARKKGNNENAREYFDQALDIADDVSDQHGKAITLTNLGVLAFREGDYVNARDHYAHALDLIRDVGDQWIEADSLNGLGEVHRAQGKYTDAREYFEESLAIRERIGDRRGTAESMSNLAALRTDQGDYETARTKLSESLRIAREIGDEPGEATGLTQLGRVKRNQGAYEAAHESLNRAAELFRKQNEQAGLGTVHLEVARLALAEGNTDQSCSRLRQATDTFEQLEATHDLARCQLVSGQIAAANGAEDDPQEHWETALAEFLDVGCPQDALRTLRLLLQRSLANDDTQQARRWHEQASELLETAPEPVVSRHEDWFDRHRGNLDTN